MTYLLTVMRIEPNPKYDESRPYERESQYVTTQVLQMEVTPEQFDRIRSACLEVAK